MTIEEIHKVLLRARNYAYDKFMETRSPEDIKWEIAEYVCDCLLEGTRAITDEPQKIVKKIKL